MDTAALFPLVIALVGTLAARHGLVTRESHIDIQLHLRIDPSVARMVRVKELRREAEEIWQPYGVRITWSDSSPQIESFPLTALLGSRMEEQTGGPFVLGRAVVGLSDPPTRPIRFSFEAIEQVLATRPHTPASTAVDHDREVARALGRVLAHEIGHVVLALRTHDDTGLMRARFTPDELARVDRSPFALTSNAVGRLKSRIQLLGMH